jgi:formamidopyrimidine-DNA glycosylase
MCGQTVLNVQRRAKYLLLETAIGSAILHLGMSGSLRIVDDGITAEKHDHVDIIFKHGKVLRLRDPRRFGAVLWTQSPIEQHKLFCKLGPEPLSDEFTAEYLHHQAKNRQVSIKGFIMNAHIVVGVGNIYASESLFMAGIHPKRAAGRVSLKRLKVLVENIKQVLQRSIEQGGTTLKDFANPEGQSGYFQVALQVYGKTGEACQHCGASIKKIKLGQRSTFYCPSCQR